MVSACLEAYRITGDKSWHKEARRAFDWFLGRNDLASSHLRSDDGRLSRRLASRPPERKSRRGVDPGVSSGVLELRLAENTLLNVEAGSSMSNHHVELFQRHEHNPILTAADWPYPVNSVFNPGRRCCPTGRRCCCAASKTAADIPICASARSANGVDHWQIDSHPTLLGRSRNLSRRAVGYRGPAHHFRSRIETIRHRLHRVYARRSGRIAGAHGRFPRLRALRHHHVRPKTRTPRCFPIASAVSGP